MRRFAVFAAVTFLLFAGCSGDPMFDGGVTEAPGVTISTIPDGSLVAPGTPIQVNLVPAEGAKSKSRESWSLETHLAPADGAAETALKFGPDTLAGGGPASVPLPAALEPGLYSVTFTLKDGDEKIAERKTVFFCDSGTYGITKIAAYPPSFLPGSTGIFRAFFSVPAGADPFFRWIVDGRTVQEAVVSRGGDRFLWNAPAVEGVYAVRVELFPFPPSPGSSFGFPASVRLAGQVYVDKTRRLADTDFAPESEYYSLFHFLGNLNDDGFRNDKTGYGGGNLETIGEPKMDFLQDAFGYLLDGKSGFKAAEILLPAAGERFSPFTLAARLFPGDDTAGRVLFRTMSDDGLFEFSVFTDQEGVLSCRMISGDARIEKKAGVVLPSGKTVLLELFVESSGDTLVSQWKLDGRIVSSSADAFVPGPLPARGYSFIGGPGGIAGLLDEFGIRTKPPEGAAGDVPSDAGAQNPPE